MVEDNGEKELQDRARRLSEVLCRRGWLLVTAESCTGGYIAKLMTDEPGSSQLFWGAMVVYSNQAKMTLLGVPAQTIADYGAVSCETAMAMADGAIQRSEADIALAVTGIAGPGGATPDKPVGAVWLAASSRNGINKTKLLQLKGDRNDVRHQSAAAGLNMLLTLTDDAAP